eukprot:jgi/Undpi1/8714/HiC_scaffold_25.g11179.m1
MDVDGDGDTSDIYDALSLGDYLSALTAGGGGAGGDDGVALDDADLMNYFSSPEAPDQGEGEGEGEGDASNGASPQPPGTLPDSSGGDLNPVEQMLVPQLAEASSNARSSPVMFGDQLPPPPWMGVLEPNPNPNPDPHAGFPPTANPNPSRDYDDDGDDDYLHGYRHGYGPGLGYDNDNDNDNDNDMGESTGAVRDQGAGESTAMATDQGMEEGTAMVLDQGVDEGTGMVLETGTAMVLEKGTAMVLDLGAEEAGKEETSVSAAAAAAKEARQRQRGQVRTYSEEADAAPLKQTVVATVVGNPDVSADGAREGEAFDGRVRLLERERGYRGPNRVAGAGRGGRGRGGEHAWNSAAVTAALAAADGGDAKATVEGVGGSPRPDRGRRKSGPNELLLRAAGVETASLPLLQGARGGVSVVLFFCPFGGCLEYRR